MAKGREIRFNDQPSFLLPGHETSYLIQPIQGEHLVMVVVCILYSFQVPVTHKRQPLVSLNKQILTLDEMFTLLLNLEV